MATPALHEPLRTALESVRALGAGRVKLAASDIAGVLRGKLPARGLAPQFADQLLKSRKTVLFFSPRKKSCLPPAV